MRVHASQMQQRLLIYTSTSQWPHSLEAALDALPNVLVVEDVQAISAALSYCASHGPDLLLVVTDWSTDILRDIQDLHQRHPRIGIVLMSVGTTPLRVAAAFAAGARGYMEAAGCCNLPSVLRLVAEGGFACCATSTGRLVEALTTANPLSKRERMIAAHISAGASNNEIAQSLGIKPATVATHIEHIQGKLGGRSRVDIATWWLSQEAKPAPPAELPHVLVGEGVA